MPSPPEFSWHWVNVPWLAPNPKSNNCCSDTWHLQHIFTAAWKCDFNFYSIFFFTFPFGDDLFIKSRLKVLQVTIVMIKGLMFSSLASWRWLFPPLDFHLFPPLAGAVFVASFVVLPWYFMLESTFHQKWFIDSGWDRQCKHQLVSRMTPSRRTFRRNCGDVWLPLHVTHKELLN